MDSTDEKMHKKMRMIREKEAKEISKKHQKEIAKKSKLDAKLKKEHPGAEEFEDKPHGVSETDLSKQGNLDRIHVFGRFFAICSN